MASTPAVQKLLTMAGKFVAKHEGDWDHEDWEKFLAKIATYGIPLDDETRRNLGNILEAGKYFHYVIPAETLKKAKKKQKKREKAEQDAATPPAEEAEEAKTEEEEDAGE